MLEYSPIALGNPGVIFQFDTGHDERYYPGHTPSWTNNMQGIQIADDITWTKIWNAT